jgi:MFS-type transporter involved in bile tolerance (Atg22 family)
MSSPDEPTDEREPHGELWVDRWILPALCELTLLPIVLVVVGHLVAIIAPTLINALRDHEIGAQMAVIGLMVLTFGCVRFEVRRHGRPALLSAWIGATWLTSIAAAWACNRYSIL